MGETKTCDGTCGCVCYEAASQLRTRVKELEGERDALRAECAERLTKWEGAERLMYREQDRADVAESALKAMTEERDALAKFKVYVHERLDQAGVAKNPGGPHTEKGCRIGDRLDLIITDRNAERRGHERHFERANKAEAALKAAEERERGLRMALEAVRLWKKGVTREHARKLGLESEFGMHGSLWVTHELWSRVDAALASPAPAEATGGRTDPEMSRRLHHATEVADRNWLAKVDAEGRVADLQAEIQRKDEALRELIRAASDTANEHGCSGDLGARLFDARAALSPSTKAATPRDAVVLWPPRTVNAADLLALSEAVLATPPSPAEPGTRTAIRGVYPGSADEMVRNTYERARDAALEEAANIARAHRCSDLGDTGSDVAERIRALKSKPAPDEVTPHRFQPKHGTEGCGICGRPVPGHVGQPPSSEKAVGES